MKTIIAGSRNIDDYEFLKFVINGCPFQITGVICGLANGVDLLGERYALANKIPIKYFSPDWTQFGKRAGIIRNEKMAENAQALIYIWDGKSRGTKHMIDHAKKCCLKIHGVIAPEFQ